MTLSSLDELVKKFDKNLFAKMGFDGTLRVYCNAFKFKAYDLEGMTLYVTEKDPYHVFSLTDTWGYNGKRRDWGYIPVENHLCRIRIENRDKQLKEIEESEKQALESKDKTRANISESMAHEMHSVLKHETKDVLFHSMDKKKDSRYLNDKKLKGI